MIYGIGTDLVRLERFEQMFKRHGERLVRHLLMTEEIELFRASAQPARFFAMHWAAKEAISKHWVRGFARVSGCVILDICLMTRVSQKLSGLNRVDLFVHALEQVRGI